jgi:hypothetical protein
MAKVDDFSTFRQSSPFEKHRFLSRQDVSKNLYAI